MLKGFNAEKKRKMLAIIEDLKDKISELEEMRRDFDDEKASPENAKALIEEIHVPALEALKEKRKTTV